ncbi:heavy-metal-associated domain-containing protein [Thioclava sp. FR2]|uniref:heavy-metal-associated domain-containing protein n=1 Tax=Thioclava sp. FR2 TaxID=3445780 RepID=UPI003EBFFC05
MKFSVPDMSCGHCTSAIEKSIKAADGSAKVECDLATRTVSIDSQLPASSLADAMKKAGYESVLA